MASASTPTERETDGLIGPVRCVRTDNVVRRSRLKGSIDSKRIPAEAVTYDRNGNRLDWSHFDDEGRLVRRYVYRHDDAGRRVESAVSGGEGELLETCTYEYDDDGMLVLDTITDARRKHVPYVHERARDEKRTIATRSRGDGTPGRRESVAYDRHGRAVEMSVYASDGKLDHRWHYGYDREGRRTSEISYYADGSFRSKEICKYNDRGNEYKLAVYRPDGSLSAKWAYTYSYDDVGNWTRRVMHLKSRGLGSTPYRPVGIIYRSIEYFDDDGPPS